MRLKDFLGPRVRFLLIAAVGFGLFLFAVESSFVVVFQAFLSAIGLLKAEQTLFTRFIPATFGGAMLALVAFGFCRGLAYMGKAYLGGVVNQAFIRYHRERILAYSLRHAQAVDSAELLNIYSERLPQVAGVVNLSAQMILTASAGILFACLGAYIAPRELALSLVLLGLILLPLKLLNRYIQSIGETVTRESETVTSILSQGLRHYFFLSVYGLVGKEIDRGQRSIRNFEESYRRFYLTYAARNALPVMGGVAVVALVSYLGTHYWQTDPVKLVAFLYILLRLGQTASESSATLAEIRLQLPALGRLLNWYEKMAPELARAASEPVIDEGDASLPLPEAVEIQADGLTYAYPGGEEVFRGVNLKVSRGDVLLITGASGAGKSTLLALLMGLRKPSKGSVRINGEAADRARAWLPRAVAYVGPEPYLIKGSVRQNLLYGNHSLGTLADARLWQALRTAKLEEEIRQLPGGLDSELREHTQLSTGQRQRLAIARALLREPRLLILDEATANLDAGTEKTILSALEEMRGRLTMIVVSHKGAFAALASQKLHMGREGADAAPVI